MSISTPNIGPEKDNQHEDSKSTGAPPRPTARRQRRGSRPAAAPVDDDAVAATGTGSDDVASDVQAADEIDAITDDVTKPEAGASSEESIAEDDAAELAEEADSDTAVDSAAEVDEADDPKVDVADGDDADEADADEADGDDADAGEADADAADDAAEDVASAEADDDDESDDDSDDDDDADDDDADDDDADDDDADDDDADDDADDADDEAEVVVPAWTPAPKVERFDPTPAAQASGRQGLFGVSGSGDTSGMSGLSTQAGSGIPSASSPRPYGGYFDEVADRFAKAYGQWGRAHIATIADRGELTFYVEKSHIAKIMQVARDDTQLRFELLSSVSGVDYFRGDAGMSSTGDAQQDEYRKQRLHVVYHLTSLTFRRRVRFEVATTVEDPHVPSVSNVYPTADWQERETYDMFGVIFDGHHALTRILMPDDWEGFPQRKDYPLGGIPVEYKGASIPPPDERRAYK